MRDFVFTHERAGRCRTMGRLWVDPACGGLRISAPAQLSTKPAAHDTADRISLLRRGGVPLELNPNAKVAPAASTSSSRLG